MNEVIHTIPAQQKDSLWKKYLSKKKSFAKARLAVDDFSRLDQPDFQEWVSTFAGEIQADTFLNRHCLELETKEIEWLLERFKNMSATAKAEFIKALKNEL